MKAKLSADKKLLTAGGRNYVFIPHQVPCCPMCAFFRSPAVCRYHLLGLPMSCDTSYEGVTADGYWKLAEK
jgi:hypothetical protein